LKKIPVIDRGLCIGCEICVEVCENEVFEMCSEKACVMYPERCTGCELCVENCPVDAISMKWTDF